MQKNQLIWTAMVTPFNEDKSLDLSSLENLLSVQSQSENGVLLLGSTGEALALEEKEKIDILKFATSLNHKIPFMVGVGGFNLQKTTSWIEFCNNLPIDAYLLLTPIYAKPGVKGQIEWFSRLLDASNKPCMLYNIPSRAGTPLSLEAAKELQDHPNFWAIKESSGSVASFQNFKSLKNIELFSGDDILMEEFGENGAVGLVSVASNVWPEETKRYAKSAIKGEKEKLIPFWKDACNALFAASNPIPAKALLHEKGLIKTATVRPPLCQDDLSDRQDLIKYDRLIAPQD